MARSRSSGMTTTGKSVSLLRKLTSHANLQTYIKRLPAPAISKLIDEIGLEDSGEIVALVSAEQMKAVLSVSLWGGARPGQEEMFNLDRFVSWIELWMQDGEQTVARRVLELDEDLVVMCLQKLLTAVDRTVIGLEESGAEIGRYTLFPKQEKHWHRIVEMLAILWRYEPDFVLRVLSRCSFERSILNDAVSEIPEETLYQDIAAERLAERRSVGYVDPMHASMFLMAAKTTDLQELGASRDYDLITADYLLKQQGASQRQTTRTSADDESELDQDRLRKSERENASAAASEDFSELDSLLRESGVLEDSQAPVALLTDQGGARPRSELLESALAMLAQEAPEVASRRMGELAYLSNVLMSGAEIQEKPFSESEAARLAIATANLGATYLLFSARDKQGDMRRAVQLLSEEPGVIRLFQIGYHLLSTLPRRCAEAVYRAKAVQARRPGHVIITEMHEVLGSSRLTDRVNEGAFGEAKLIIDGLSAVMDSAACVALRRLIDPTPCFPCVLDRGTGSENIYVNKGYRPIAAMEDIERIAEFLKELPSYCGN